MIGCFNCPTAGLRLKPTVGLHCTQRFVKNEAANVPTMFEEFLMAMI